MRVFKKIQPLMTLSNPRISKNFIVTVFDLKGNSKLKCFVVIASLFISKFYRSQLTVGELKKSFDKMVAISKVIGVANKNF